MTFFVIIFYKSNRESDYMEKGELKKKCIELYLEGKTYTEIAKLTGWSRTFITDLIKNDEKIIEKNNTKKIKLYKRKDNKQVQIYIPTEFIRKMGISKDTDDTEYVDIYFDENTKNIVIKKHSE